MNLSSLGTTPAYQMLIPALNAYAQRKPSQRYTWKVPQFERRRNEGDSDGDRAVFLRHHLHSEFKKADEGRRQKIVRFYVQNFGGIRNDPEITPLWKTYADIPAEEFFNRLRRISSWSKALAVRDPGRFLIYDSRVATTLNLLQLDHHGEVALRFPVPPRRSLVLPRPNELRLRDAKVGRRLKPSETYETYLRAMSEVEPDLEKRERLEMRMFAEADHVA